MNKTGRTKSNPNIQNIPIRTLDGDKIIKAAKKSMIRQSVVDQGCQVCGGYFDEFVIDGRTVNGPWAYMCTQCHHQVGFGLGVGRGQKYDVVTLEKVEG